MSKSIVVPEDIVAGVRFRDGGKQTIIERAERAIDMAYDTGVAHGRQVISARIDEKDRQLAALRIRVRRLEDSIKQIKAHQATEIISAITNSGENAAEFGPVPEVRGALLGSPGDQYAKAQAYQYEQETKQETKRG